MSELAATNPYEAFMDTPEWALLDRAIQELARNNDLKETTAHPYIVGYLCRALAEHKEPNVARPRKSREELQTILEQAQAEVRAANPSRRDLLAELIAERRAEAASE